MMIFQKSSSRIRKINIFDGGGSVWELKIDPKRLREEIKNDIEKRRKKKTKKSIKSDKNVPGSKRVESL